VLRVAMATTRNAFPAAEQILAQAERNRWITRSRLLGLVMAHNEVGGGCFACDAADDGAAT